MEQNLWCSDSRVADQDVLPKFHSRVHKSPSLACILSQINAVHTLTSCLFRMHFHLHPVRAYMCLYVWNSVNIFSWDFSLSGQGLWRSLPDIATLEDRRSMSLRNVCNWCHIPKYRNLRGQKLRKKYYRIHSHNLRSFSHVISREIATEAHGSSLNSYKLENTYTYSICLIFHHKIMTWACISINST
jgi:hypothetical protein